MLGYSPCWLASGLDWCSEWFRLKFKPCEASSRRSSGPLAALDFGGNELVSQVHVVENEVGLLAPWSTSSKANLYSLSLKQHPRTTVSVVMIYMRTYVGACKLVKRVGLAVLCVQPITTAQLPTPSSLNPKPSSLNPKPQLEP